MFPKAKLPALASYALAAAIGLLLAVSILPPGLILGTDPNAPPLTGDSAAHYTAMRYFIWTRWSWPPFNIPTLGEPPGTNLALADGIPIISLPLKILRHWLPFRFDPLYPWLTLCCVLQPAAALFAVRSSGERRLIPGIAAAILSISIPIWLGRYIHAALTGQFLLLLAIGLYARACANKSWMAAANALLLASLFIHPYLMAMVAAILLSIPLTLLIRGDRRWPKSFIALLPACALIGLCAVLLGYTGNQPAGGFSLYSMNLFGPFFPARAAMVPGPGVFLDATGGQWEGQAYLGIGLIVLMLAATVLAAMKDRQILARHAGLLVMCAALTLYALSNHIYAGTVSLVQIPDPPGFLQQFRATGRFFWPVTYVILVASVVVAAKRLPFKIALTVLILTSAMQFDDMAIYRQNMRDGLVPSWPWSFDKPRAIDLLSHSQKLSIRPKFYCGSSAYTEPALAELLVLASKTLIPVDTFFAARQPRAMTCPADDAALQLGELRVYTKGFEDRALQLPDPGAACRLLQEFTVCTRHTALLDGLPPISLNALPVIETGKPLAASTPPASPFLPSGWGPPEPAGRWTIGPSAKITGRLAPQNSGRIKLRLTGFALSPTAGGEQTVTLISNGEFLASWRLADRQSAALDAIVAPTQSRTLALELRIARPVRPADRAIDGDMRPLGFFLQTIEFDNADSSQR